MRTSCNVLVEIVHQNDNNLIFGKSIYTANIPENQLSVLPVVKVFATDTDSGLNAKIAYSMAEFQPSFAIDSATGHITLQTIGLDRESIPVHRFSINACDQGKRQRCSSADIVITLLDVNDNAPQGQINPGYLNLTEDTEIGAIVTKFNGFDLDEGENCRFHFKIESRNIETTFAIDPVQET